MQADQVWALWDVPGFSQAYSGIWVTKWTVPLENVSSEWVSSQSKKQSKNMQAY